MTYSIHWFDEAQTTFRYLAKDDLRIPLDPANRHYQEVLDAIIAEGADCFDGDIPADLQAAADAKLAAGLYQPDPHA
jgi:hypothetical protein